VDKQTLREEARSRIGALDDAYRERWLPRITTEVDGLVIGPAVMLYAAFRREVSVDEVIASTLYHHRWCALPRVTPDGLVAHRVDDLETQLVAGGWGIREPRPELPVVDPATLDTIVVPGRAFDARGGRVGWGKAHYDRFLARTRPGVRKIGVCWEAQVFDEVPVDEHDQRMTVVVTERRTYWPP